MAFKTTNIGADRPNCGCHNEPMNKDRIRHGNQQWICSNKALKRNRKWRSENPNHSKEVYRQNKEAGICVQHGCYNLAEVVIVSCGSCRDKENERLREKYAIDWQFAHKAQEKARKRQAKKRRERIAEYEFEDQLHNERKVS